MLNIKPITAPRGTLSPAKYKKAIDLARGIAEIAGLQEARGITRGWRNTPAWRIKRRGAYKSDIVTNDKIFGYQDKGTRGPYTITPRKKRALFWKGAAHPVKRVRHPGLKAQHYSEKIAAAMQKQYQRIMQTEINRVIP